jgi:squalene/oxidosqualene cyclase-like protein
MCFLYGRRFVYPGASKDPMTLALREELYTAGQVYDDIEWGNFLHTIADVDNYSPIHWAMRLLQNVLATYESFGAFQWPRQASMRFAEEYIMAEDLETNYLTIGPVSKALHVVCAWVMAGGEKDAKSARESKPFRAHVERVPAYLWVAEDGMKVQGYNGSMMWDTSFALQAVAEANLQSEFAEMSKKGFQFIAKEQVRALPHGDWKFWRQPIRGGWGFSTAEQAWPVSDTTAEAFKAVLALRKDKCIQGCKDMPDEHYFDTVQFLLSYQNPDGGWATYENNRGWKWYELLNPSEVFGDIMIDYSYIECSSSSMSALAEFSKQFPDHRSEEIAQSIRRGRDFIKAMQRDDGSWYGCWGNCFTYGCWFGIEGLLTAGEPTSCPAIKRCVAFLLSKQEPDGGWGEDFLSCFNREYTTFDKLYGCDSGSNVVCTGWALLGIMAGDCEDKAAVKRGIDFLIKRQLPSGDWAQENIAGVFNRSIGISYTAFRNVYPLWALGRFIEDYGPRHGLMPKAS